MQCYSIIDAPESGHPREADKVSVTGGGRLRTILVLVEFKRGFVIWRP